MRFFKSCRRVKQPRAREMLFRISVSLCIRCHRTGETRLSTPAKEPLEPLRKEEVPESQRICWLYLWRY